MRLHHVASPASKKQIGMFCLSMPLIQPINDIDDPSPYPRRKESILDKFNRFHTRNPNVYVLIVDISKSMKRSGVHKFGMKGVFEYMRWQYAIQTQGDSYKLNNVFTALYSRLIMDQEPDLRGFFETRRRVSE